MRKDLELDRLRLHRQAQLKLNEVLPVANISGEFLTRVVPTLQLSSVGKHAQFTEVLPAALKDNSTLQSFMLEAFWLACALEELAKVRAVFRVEFLSSHPGLLTRRGQLGYNLH